jgi:hypothetical protein
VDSKLGPLGTSATEWPIVPAPGNYDDGKFGGMKSGRGNRSTRKKPAPAPLCPPQIPLDQTRARTRAAAVGSQRLSAWAMARPSYHIYCIRLMIVWVVFQIFHIITYRAQSVSGLDGRGSIPGRRNFFQLHISHPACYPMSTGDSIPGGKTAGALSWPLKSIWCRGQDWWSYIFTSPYVFMARCLIN